MKRYFCEKTVSFGTNHQRGKEDVHDPVGGTKHMMYFDERNGANTLSSSWTINIKDFDGEMVPFDTNC